MPDPDTSKRREPAELLQRARTTTRTVATRMRRSPPASQVRTWTPQMSVVALAALSLSVLAGLLIDSAAISFVREHYRDPLIRLLASITDLGASEWYLVPAGLAVVTLALADWSSRGARARSRLTYVFGVSAYLFAAVALSGILVNVAKLLVGRARPILFDELGPWAFRPFQFEYSFLSYPSGHSTTVGAAVLVAMLLLPRLRWLALALGAVVAFSRVAALAHYPGDVIAGFAFGWLFALWLARWLAARGLVFRTLPGRVLPVPRHQLAWRRRARGR